MKEDMFRETEDLPAKYDRLVRHIAEWGSAAIAFSGGVDSAFLLRAAADALGDRMIAVTAVTPFFPARETREAEAYCRDAGIRQILIRTEESEIPGFAENPTNRCYLCKRVLFQRFLETAASENMAQVAEGSNLDDNGDYRPGLQAVAELGIKSPLREIGFTKAEIREMSKRLGIPCWDKPSFACLASRFPYGEVITEERLRMVERAEAFLLELGFPQFRVRLHGDVARIELLPADFDRFMKEEIRLMVYDRFRELGFSYTALDLAGYRTGSLNETISG